MGTTLQCVFVGQTPLPPESISATDLVHRVQHTDWWVIQRTRPLPLPDLEHESLKASGKLRKSLAVHIEDSDYTFLAGFTGGRPAWAFVFNQRSAEQYEEGRAAVRRCRELRSDATHEGRDPAESIAEWSSDLPRSASKVELSRALHEKPGPFAEDSVNLFLQLMGLSLPLSERGGFGDATLVVDNGKSSAAGREIDLSKARFVWGWGDDFYGIWDRQRPQAPVERYPNTSEGRRRSIERWSELLGTD